MPLYCTTVEYCQVSELSCGFFTYGLMEKKIDSMPYDDI